MPEPSQVQSPTDAPTVPTEVPTDAPTVPTAEAVEGVSAQERAYWQSTLPHIEGITYGLARIGELFSNPQFGNDEWTLQVGGAMAAIRVSHDRLVALEPPDSLIEIHDRLTTGTQFCNDATFMLAEGVDNRDAEKLESSSTLIRQCTAAISALSLEVTEP